MSKQIKTKSQVKAVSVASEAPARRFWLAGLGAFSVAQKQGGKVFEGLVNEGRSFQDRSGKLARQVGEDVGVVVRTRLKPVQQHLDAVRRDASIRFERGLGQALSYAGVPSKADVDALIKRIDTLSRQLRAAK